METAKIAREPMMGFDACLYDDEGVLREPVTEGDWEEWVSAGRTRNFCNGDTLVDWLDRHGEARGFVPDSKGAGYDASLDFGQYVLDQGPRFEAAVLAHLGTQVPILRLGAEFEKPWEAVRSLDVARQTFEAMQRGVPVISQGVLRNAAGRTFGAADLLIRSDVLMELFPEAISEVEARIPAPGIGAPNFHYRVVDVKFSTLKLGKNGEALADHKAYMVQVYLYSQALGRIQGYVPRAAYLLGRGWEDGERGTNCMERLAAVPMDRAIRDVPVASLAADAVTWVRRVRREGAGWDVLPMPSVPELYPCDGNSHSWHSAVSQIANAIEDVTLMWQVGPTVRRRAHAEGVYSWRDPRCTAEVLGLRKGLGGTYTAVREINLSSDGEPVQPARIRAEPETWGRAGGVEFYVDFEWSNGLNDDFSRVPEQNGSSVIFMIGCGHIEQGTWRFECFIADDLGEAAEERVIDAWFAHMAAVTERLAAGTNPLVFHWSPAEDAALTNQWNSARQRHRDSEWPQPNWFDFLNRVMKAEPVVVRGAMAFGLKPVAKAMHRHGFIETLWPDSVVDGLGAMVAAWRCEEQARANGWTLAELPLMQAVRAYNEVDCKAMMEIVAYLRGRVTG